MKVTNEIMNIATDVANGETNALDAWTLLTEIKKAAETALKQIKESTLAEAANYTDKRFDHNGWTFELRDGSRRYDFSGCPSWVAVDQAKKDVEAALKAALQAAEKGAIVPLDEETGELIPLPVVKYSEPSITIRPAKP